MKHVIKKAASYVRGRLSKYRNRAKFEELVKAGFPAAFTPAARFFLDESTLDPDARAKADKVEAIRAAIAAGGDTPVEILYSPTPGSSGNEVTPDIRPSHGKILSYTMKQAAQTGKGRRWGLFLHLCARAAQSPTILELGACVGISGCYLSSTPSCRKFITIEGSPSLARLAEQSLKKMGGPAVVYNKLFDDALDTILPEVESLDFVFIDGHHEKVATIHYFQRVTPKLAPGAIVVFDDISWSADMRECWNQVAADQGFSDAVDCGEIGVCIWNPDAGGPRYWDLQEVWGKTPIGDPHGWKK